MLKRLKSGREQVVQLKVEGVGLPVLLRRSTRARRFSLQVSEAKRGAILTMPVYSSYAEANEFLSRHLDWLKERVAGLSEPVPFSHGATVPLRGEAYRLGFAGPVKRRGVVWIEQEEDARPVPAWPSVSKRAAASLPLLWVAGEPEHAPRRLLDWLRRQAHQDLKIQVALHAKRLRLEPKRIFIRDQTTRWGSCSTSGALSFSWRLIMAPPFILDYLALHEVAHLAEMNHGPRFWGLVSKIMPDYEEAQEWLREHGSSLHRYGAEAPLLTEAQFRSPKLSIE